MLSALGFVPAFNEASGDLGPLPPGGSHPSRSHFTPAIQFVYQYRDRWKARLTGALLALLWGRFAAPGGG
jgi:hypothetical protein